MVSLTPPTRTPTTMMIMTTTTRRRIPQWFRQSLPPYQRRTLAAWWRGGGGKSTSQPSMVTVDVSKKRHYPIHIVNDEYRVSICSIQGYRDYMEDEFMIHTTAAPSDASATNTTTTTGTANHQHDPNHQEHTHGIVACFDGHGGKAVSRYLRQNLYTNLLAALTMIQHTKPKRAMMNQQQPTVNQMEPHQSTTDAIVNDNDLDDDETVASIDMECPNDEGQTHHHLPLDNDQHPHPPIHPDTSNDDDDDMYMGQPHTIILPPAPPRGTLMPPVPNNTTTPVVPTTNNNTTNHDNEKNAATVDDYVSALEVALDKVDREVLRVRHWKRKGSTAIVCWIHTEETTASSPAVDVAPTTNTDPPTPPRTTTRTLITANIGDSRAVLCRNGVAIPLSRDHRPDDPIEFQRIHRVGGTVFWDGKVDRMLEPIPGMGCYRVNGNLALSRAIGDRSDRPVINSDPDITLITLVPPEDEFIVVATDGLWDVLSSSDTVAFIRALLDNMDQDAIDRDSIASYVVEEALRRGSYDNITVIIVWLQ